MSSTLLEALGPLGDIVPTVVTPADGAVFKLQILEAPGAQPTPEDSAVLKLSLRRVPARPADSAI